MWVLVAQGEEGREARSRGKVRRGEGIRRLGISRGKSEERERANRIEGIGNVRNWGEGT